MEDLKNGMKDRLPYFHANYIYSIFQNLQQITKDYQTKMRMISHFSVRVSPNPPEMEIYYRFSLLLKIVLNYRSILLLYDMLLSPMNYRDKQFFMPTVFKTSKSVSWRYGMNTPGVGNLWRMRHTWRNGYLKVAHCAFLMTSLFYSLIFCLFIFFICPPPIFFGGKQNI